MDDDCKDKLYQHAKKRLFERYNGLEMDVMDYLIWIHLINLGVATQIDISLRDVDKFTKYALKHKGVLIAVIYDISNNVIRTVLPPSELTAKKNIERTKRLVKKRAATKKQLHKKGRILEE